MRLRSVTALLLIVGSFFLLAPNAAAIPLCLGSDEDGDGEQEDAVCTEVGTDRVCAWEMDTDVGACAFTLPKPRVCVYAVGEEVCSYEAQQEVGDALEDVLPVVEPYVGIVVGLALFVVDVVLGVPGTIDDLYPGAVCTPEDETAVVCVDYYPRTPFVGVCVYSITSVCS